ncbi:MAG: transcriptional repressor [Clostridiales bacterium]|nr:transcriptional repressor [Clostridiales bacterium]
MKPSFEALKQELARKNIHLSHQRLKVLDYLTRYPCHPTAEQIFADLHKDLSTLSKTTVYNTLRTLAEAGLVRVITTDNNESRYEIATDNHGHFKCDCCGAIYDFWIDTEALHSPDLAHFEIGSRSVYFKGVCPRCL